MNENNCVLYLKIVKKNYDEMNNYSLKYEHSKEEFWWDEQ